MKSGHNTSKVTKHSKKRSRKMKREHSPELADEPTRDNYDSFMTNGLHDLNQSLQNLNKVKYSSLIEDAETNLSTNAGELSMFDRTQNMI